MTETGWYNGDQKPVRVGAYKRRYSPNSYVYFCWWNGSKWGFAYDTAESAKRGRKYISSVQNRPWCSLIGEPK